mmetsp:Transcript_9660/g.27639  ORF Transcript_9660/g.27639 Transcript_9660/m.27639 type:complete len:359 (+) Transcript_9660:309-1385(+)
MLPVSRRPAVSCKAPAIIRPRGRHNIAGPLQPIPVTGCHGMEVSLLRVDLQGSADWPLSVRQASLQTSKRLYTWFQGPPTQRCSIDTLQALADLYEAVAEAAPTLDVVPMFECAGWSTAAVACLPELTSAALGAGEKEGTSWVEELNRHRSDTGLQPVGLTRLPPPPGGSARQQEQQGGQPGSSRPVIELSGRAAAALEFSDVAVGGTFDNLHAGHRLLLSAAAVVTTETLWLGLTSDALLASKSNKELLEPYEERDCNTQAFLQRVRPGLRVSSGPLTDPKELPLAGTMEAMQALVVSRETTAGAEWINSHRQSVGFQALAVVVVGLIGATGQQADTKLSSSSLREAKAAAADSNQG